MSQNIFEQASRKRIRFDSVQGELSVEHLWHLPLTSATKANLDDVAKEVNRQLIAAAETSFVKQTSPAKNELELKMEVVKHIIGVRLEENAAAAEKAANKDKANRLVAALEAAENKQFENMTPDQIKAEIAKLQG